MPELKPCPFCGGEAKVHFYPELGGRFAVMCESDFSVCNVKPRTGWFRAKKKATEAWNRRATPSDGGAGA